MEMSEFDLGFVVGMLEGEGHVGLYCSRSRSHGMLALGHSVDFSNSNLDIVNRLIGILDEDGVAVTSYRHSGSCQMYHVKITKQGKALDFLETVKPYLVSERLLHRCELVIEWLKHRIERQKMSAFWRYYHGGYSEREWQIYNELKVGGEK